MSLSTCLWCGGDIPLGPETSNCCVLCGKHVMSAPQPAAQLPGHIIYVEPDEWSVAQYLDTETGPAFDDDGAAVIKGRFDSSDLRAIASHMDSRTALSPHAPTGAQGT